MNFVAKTFNELTTDELYEILKARFQIFVLEQKIMCQDMDDLDRVSLHCFFTENGKVIACMRAYYTDTDHTEVKIGRVLTLTHGNGIGKALMEESLQAIQKKMPYKKLFVNAQRQAEGYYKKMGFSSVSHEFIEAGIPHIRMEYN